MKGNGNEYRAVYLAIGSVFSLFIIVSFILPFYNPGHSLVHLNGAAGVMDHQSLWGTLDPVSALFYTMGDLGCHQSQGRTLVFNGNEIPFCIRDTFIFIGFAVGFLLHGFGFSIRRHGFSIGLALVALTLLEWSSEHYLDLGGPTLRAAVSVISGIGAVMMADSILRWETEFLERKKAEKRKQRD